VTGVPEGLVSWITFRIWRRLNRWSNGLTCLTRERCSRQQLQAQAVWVRNIECNEDDGPTKGRSPLIVHQSFRFKSKAQQNTDRNRSGGLQPLVLAGCPWHLEWTSIRPLHETTNNVKWALNIATQSIVHIYLVGVLLLMSGFNAAGYADKH
jgi:hypothetical protein